PFEIRFGRADLLLQQGGIDSGEELPLLHVVVEVDEDLRDLAGDLRSDFHRLRGLEVAGTGDGRDHVPPRHRHEPVAVRGVPAPREDHPDTDGDDRDHGGSEQGSLHSGSSAGVARTKSSWGAAPVPLLYRGSRSKFDTCRWSPECTLARRLFLREGTSFG